MVAFKGSRGQRICAQPPTDLKALLVYGPNAGLVRESAKAAITFIKYVPQVYLNYSR